MVGVIDRMFEKVALILGIRNSEFDVTTGRLVMLTYLERVEALTANKF